MKKFLLFFVSVFFLGIINQSVYAQDTKSNSPQNEFNTDIETFQSFIKEWNLDSISYEDWKELIEQAEKDYKEMDSEEISNDFLRSDTNGSGEGGSLRSGDILVTNHTSSKGLTGHAGIAIGGNEILHIEGTGKKPSTLTFNQWKNRYNSKGTWTKVYRHKDVNVANKAANWARTNYKGKNYSYNITTSLGAKDVNPTYCSKIVWQAYRYGAGTSYATKPSTNLILPYSLNSYIKSDLVIHIKN